MTETEVSPNVPRLPSVGRLLLATLTAVGSAVVIFGLGMTLLSLPHSFPDDVPELRAIFEAMILVLAVVLIPGCLVVGGVGTVLSILAVRSGAWQMRYFLATGGGLGIVFAMFLSNRMLNETSIHILAVGVAVGVGASAVFFLIAAHRGSASE